MKRARGFGKPSPSRTPPLDRWLRTADAHYRSCELDAARALYCQILDAAPQHPDALHRLGLLLYLQGDPFSAEAPLSQLVALHPVDASAHNNLGVVLEAQGRAEEAEAGYRRAIALDPQLSAAHNGLGNALLEQGDAPGAEASYRQAIALDPGYAEAHNGLGNALLEQGDPQAALVAYEQAVQLQPDLADAQANCAYLRLLLGDFERGWQAYEWRWRTGWAARPETILGRPRWDGSDLAGRAVLLVAEQGFGDTIQFVRYAPLVSGRGASRVFLLCRPAERRLLSTCGGIDGLLVQGESLPDFDLCAPLGSPGLFGPELPAQVPYLRPPAAPADPSWIGRVSATGALRVGLVWSATRLRYHDRKRCCPLQLLAPLLEWPELAWFSLYKGEAGKAELEPYRAHIVDLGPYLQDFADTAWAMTQLDLIITVDTATAHLAGALGLPVWILLPCVPDWRWMLQRSDSPWYPSARLFRQSTPGDWQGVIQQLAVALGQWCGKEPAYVPAPAVSATGSQNLSPIAIAIPRAVQLAARHHEAGRRQQAKDIYAWILRHDPDHPDATAGIGMLALEAGDTQTAQAALRRVIALKPQDALAHYQLAQVYLSLDKTAQAEVHCERALTLDPALAEAHVTLAHLLAVRGALAEAQKHLECSLKLRPDFAGARNNLGNLLQQQGRLEEALECYRQALASKPDLEAAWLNYDRLLSDLAATRQKAD